MRAILISLVALSFTPALASAQTFPADNDWEVLDCGGVPSFDPVADEPAAIDERDVVGDASDPALYVFADATHFFFRMRVEDDPLNGGMFTPFGWAVEISTDGDATSYELLLVVDGIANPDEVGFHRNTTQATPNDPADPPEALITTYAIPASARGVPAMGGLGSNFGGDGDFFVDWAVPLADLEAEGITPTTLLEFVMGTSTSARAIDADVACFDDAGGGAPTWSGTSTDPVTPDAMPPVGVDGGTVPDGGAGVDGGGPVADGSTGLGIRGGPGACAVTSGRTPDGGSLFAILAALFSGRTLSRVRRARATGRRGPRPR